MSAIVNTSQMTSRRDSKSHAAQNHWIAERVFDWCGVPVTYLRPTLFAELAALSFLLEKHRRKEHPRSAFWYGTVCTDRFGGTGRVVAAILARPTEHAGSTYQLFGPLELDGDGIAAATSEVLGRTIRYSAVEITEFEQMLAHIPRLPPYFVQHVGAIAVDCQNGVTARHQ